MLGTSIKRETSGWRAALREEVWGCWLTAAQEESVLRTLAARSAKCILGCTKESKNSRPKELTSKAKLKCEVNVP